MHIHVYLYLSLHTYNIAPGPTLRLPAGLLRSFLSSRSSKRPGPVGPRVNPLSSSLSLLSLFSLLSLLGLVTVFLGVGVTLVLAGLTLLFALLKELGWVTRVSLV